jgi:adenine-specific DNA-methyltransferase
MNLEKPKAIAAVDSSAGTLEAGRVMSRALAALSPEAGRLALARGFGSRLVTAWWRAFSVSMKSPELLRSPVETFDLVELPDAALALADSLGAAAATHHPEAAAYQIGQIYTGMLPIEYRSALGVYYTPPALSARLIAQAGEAGVDWTRARVLDPACGGGGFLAPVAQRMIDDLKDCSPRILIENLANRLRGYEVDPFGAWLSQVALDAIVLPIATAAGRRLPSVVTVCDSLRRSPPRDRFDLVIGNPPYGRVALDAAERARFRRSLFGHANLYGLFTGMALRHARPGGVIAFVTPTSFLAGEYFKNLRALLGRDAPPVTIDFVSARRGVFDDVLQETLLATYRRGGEPGAVTVHEIRSRSSSSVEIELAGEVPFPAEPSQPWLLPRNRQEAAMVARLAKMSHRLADWGYSVSTGPLVWNRHKSQLRDRPGKNRLPLVWAEAITPDGRFMFRAEKRNHAPYFELRKGDEWLVVGEPCVLLQRTTAKEQQRRLIAAALPAKFLEEHGGAVIENHVNMLKAIVEEPSVPAEILAAFLNSTAADRAFRCVSGSVAVSAFELEALPLPAPEELVELGRLVRLQAAREEIEAECLRLYAGEESRESPGFRKTVAQLGMGLVGLVLRGAGEPDRLLRRGSEGPLTPHGILAS